MTDEDKLIAEIEALTSPLGEALDDKTRIDSFCRCAHGILIIVKRQREALRGIAKQRLHSEIADCDPDEIDWLSGYEGCVKRAREALP